MIKKVIWMLGLCTLLMAGIVSCDDDLDGEDVLLDPSIKLEGSKTDSDAVNREEEAIKLDGLNVAQMKELRSKSEKHQFQAEVNRMMKLIINSLYRNKEIFLRELISNASDALDKIRVLSLSNPDALKYLEQLYIRIKADKENGLLHITDSGVGMTKQELMVNLGTIAKSGTADFLAKAANQEAASKASPTGDMNDLIGQFGVGFYSAFLVADKVVVTSKSNDDDTQHIWESDSNSFSLMDDPRGDSLKRGTTITLKVKDEAKDFLQEETLKKLIDKYSQFINFPIYLWESSTIEVEEPEDDIEEDKKEDDKEGESEKKEPKKVEKTVWDWKLINTAKPIWQRKPKDIPDSDYNEFYKSITKDSQDPLAKSHFVAEGEVTFKSVLFIPKVQPNESFNKYGTKTDTIKLYVRRVFITDDFQDMMPSFLNFVRGVVDSDDLPLSVSRENLQQHKLLKVIKKKLVRKALDMIKKISGAEYDAFWSEYGTNMKLGVIEDTSNRVRLAKLLQFQSSEQPVGKMTSLNDYITRMKNNQDSIYYIAATSYEEAAASPFVETLLKKGYEVLYLTDAVDEYAISAIPEFEGKKFQNVAKDGLKLGSGTKAQERLEALNKEYEPLIKWLEGEALKDKVSKVSISQRLHDSPCALIASQFGWTGNMERLARSNAHSKSKDVTRDYYLSQKKGLEINPKHPVIKELLKRVQVDEQDYEALTMSNLMFETATLRSGFMLPDTASFANRVDSLLKQSLGIAASASVEQDDELDLEEEVVPEVPATSEQDDDNDHDEL